MKFPMKERLKIEKNVMDVITNTEKIKQKKEQNFCCICYSPPIFKDPDCVALIMYAQAAPNNAIPMIAEGVTNKVKTKNTADNKR